MVRELVFVGVIWSQEGPDSVRLLDFNQMIELKVAKSEALTTLVVLDLEHLSNPDLELKPNPIPEPAVQTLSDSENGVKSKSTTAKVVQKKRYFTLSNDRMDPTLAESFLFPPFYFATKDVQVSSVLASLQAVSDVLESTATDEQRAKRDALINEAYGTGAFPAKKTEPGKDKDLSHETSKDLLPSAVVDGTPSTSTKPAHPSGNSAQPTSKRRTRRGKDKPAKDTPSETEPTSTPAVDRTPQITAPQPLELELPKAMPSVVDMTKAPIYIVCSATEGTICLALIMLDWPARLVTEGHLISMLDLDTAGGKRIYPSVLTKHWRGIMNTLSPSKVNSSPIVFKLYQNTQLLSAKMGDIPQALASLGLPPMVL